MATERWSNGGERPGDEPAGAIAGPRGPLLRSEEVAAAMALAGFVLLFVAIALLAPAAGVDAPTLYR